MRQARPAAVRLFPIEVTRALDGDRSSPGASAIRATYVPVTKRISPVRAIMPSEITLKVGNSKPSEKTIKMIIADQTGASLVRCFPAMCRLPISARSPDLLQSLRLCQE